MTSRWNLGRAATLALVGSALGIALGSAPVQAQCVGDCSGAGEVSIGNLITGVNIALGSQPVSACEAFANSDGEVTIGQLIQGVNTALNGCPTVSPTATPTATPEAGLGSQTCNLLTNPTPGQAATASSLALGIFALPVPLTFALDGSLIINAGSVDTASGEASSSCEIGTLAPVNIPSIGFVCITQALEPCAPAKIDCDGGSPLDIEVRSDGNVGTCTGDAACETLCDTHCDSIGAVQQSSGCTGYCSEGTGLACLNDAECLASNSGACNGPDPVGNNFDICQCQCVNGAVGAPARPGDFQCNLGSVLVVENQPPCDGTDIRINVGTTCVALTTGTATTLITDANFQPGTTVPKSGEPAGGQGTPVTCANYEAGDLTGLKIRGAVNFFGSALGDIASTLAVDCASPQ